MEKNKVEFKYIKSSHFRSILATGVYGGLGPNGLINMSFYVDRAPIPDSIINEINQDGSIGKEIEKTMSNAVIREVDCNIIIDLNTAISFRTWLDNKIQAAEEMQKLIQEKGTSLK